MIGHLTGTLFEKQVQRLVVDVAGVGYEIQVPLSTFYAVGEPGSRVALRVHTHVREDALQLFGFATPLEHTLFQRLISISGIGPKAALAVLSGIEPVDLIHAVTRADVARLTRIPGVGRKTAERLVLELKDRLPPVPADSTPAPPASPVDTVTEDVLSALANLGYNRGSAESALDKVLRNSDTREFEAVLRLVLKAMAG